MTELTAIRTRSLIAAAALIALLVPFQAGSAEAAGPKGWRALGIRLRTTTVPAVPDGGVAAIAKCPRGTKVIGGGAFFHQNRPDRATGLTSSTHIGASVPLESKRGWFASGVDSSNLSDVQFSVKALCAERIAYTIRTVQSAPLSAGQTAGGYIACEPGETALGGGAYFHTGDGLATADNAERAAITSSSITHDSLAWYVHGFTLPNSGTTYMISAVICTTTALKPITPAETVVENLPTQGTMTETWAACFPDQKVLSGGSFWSNDANGPTPADADDAKVTDSWPDFASDSPLPYRWIASGQNYTLDGGEFVVRAMCLPK